MQIDPRRRIVLVLIVCVWSSAACQSRGQDRPLSAGPDPREIPVPPIATPLGTMPGARELTDHPEMPPALVMRDSTPVTTTGQWAQRRKEMKRILEYYAVGVAPPPPGNVVGRTVRSEELLGGRVIYRLVHLTFGPDERLSLDIGVFTPAGDHSVPTVISPSGSPPGANRLPRMPQGPGQGHGVDALLTVGPGESSRDANPGGANVSMPRRFGGPPSAETIAASNPAIAHGYAFVTFDHNDCGEDTTLRNADGSWAFRNTRFYPAYPGYDWGLLRGWAWGVSRIVDYLETDPTIDASKLIVTGVSRTGKAAMVAGAFDDRLAMVAPVASSGGGTPAYRYSGDGRGGREGLNLMMKKYPNWFSPQLHQFWGHVDRLPFDQHWFLALAAPRPFIALEGTLDQNVNQHGVLKTFEAARGVYEFLGAPDHLGVNWAKRPHGMVADDWDALLSFADWHLLGKTTQRQFDQFPPEAQQPSAEHSSNR
jgi:(4-O-methyl)-D-glucuronate---lignin esterase